MAGKPLFKKGTHETRLGFRAEFDEDRIEKLRVVLPQASDDDFRRLVRAVLMAKAEIKRALVHVPRRDRVAQLKAMLKLHDDDLVSSLRKCDQGTLEAIKQAQVDAISEILWSKGVFADVGGEEHRIPPGIEFVEPHSRVDPYLPMGIDGLRSAITAALAAEDASSDKAGNRAKPWQRDLARECVRLWKQYGPADKQTAHHTTRSGLSSAMVEFAQLVFHLAGTELAGSRLVDLLNGRAPKMRVPEKSK